MNPLMHPLSLVFGAAVVTVGVGVVALVLVWAYDRWDASLTKREKR